MQRIATKVSLALVLTSSLSACTTLLPATDPVSSSDAGVDAHVDTGMGMDAGPDCIDPTGFGGLGCYRCTPETRDQLLNACTRASTEVFDDSRLPPLPDGGVVAPPLDVDAAVSDAGMPSDGGMGDAGPSLPSCSSLPNVLYATGSSAVGLFLGQVAQAFEHADPPITIVYKSSGSCTGVASMVSPGSNLMTGSAVYWNPDLGVDPTSSAAQIPCALDSGGVMADVGFSDVFAATCQDLPSGLDPLGLADFSGPIQIMNFAVPISSDQRAISAEAAYLVYGFGGDTYPVPPWIDATHILQRNAASGTQALIGAALGLPRDRWRGVPNASSSTMRDALLSASSMGGPVADSTIGILASDILDPLRTNIRGLAYRHYGQSVAFYPDSSGESASRDKRNVRDGHYPLFGPLHMIARVDGSHLPISDEVHRLVNVVNGVETLPTLNIIEIYAQRSLIPQCAMRVERTSDDGDVTPYTPTTPCGCYYEQLATRVGTPPGCVACDRVDDCESGQACVRFATQTRGYCE